MNVGVLEKLHTDYVFPLLLMSQTDVVAVEQEKWTHPPFAAVIADSFIYARVAHDMKYMVTMELGNGLQTLNLPFL